MGEARNDYPRLCWGCLGIIEAWEEDFALTDFGGTCPACHSSQIGEMPGLRNILNGYTERMNSVVEQGELTMAVIEKALAGSEEQRERIIGWYSLKNVEAIRAAKQFIGAMERLQTLGPIDSTALEEIQAQLLMVGEPQEPLKSEKGAF